MQYCGLFRVEKSNQKTASASGDVGCFCALLSEEEDEQVSQSTRSFTMREGREKKIAI